MSLICAPGQNSEDHAAFEQHAAIDGGSWVLDRSQYESERLFLELPLEALCTEWSLRAAVSRDGQRFRCIAGISNERLANGASSLEKDRYCISVTYGFARRMLWLSRLVVRDGMVRNEKLGRSILNVLPLDPQNVIFGAIPDWPPINALVENKGLIIGEDNEEDRRAYVLYSDLLRLAWQHEIYHILLGHTGWLHHQHKMARLVKLSNDSHGLHPSAVDIAALEHHADHAAGASVALRILEGLDPFGLVLMPEVSIEERLGSVQVATGVLSMVWALLAQRNKHWDPEHPSPACRYLGMLGAVRQMVNESDQSQRYESSARWSFEVFARLAHRYPLFAPLASLADSHIFNDVSSERAELLSRINDLSETLRPYAFTDSPVSETDEGRPSRRL